MAIGRSVRLEIYLVTVFFAVLKLYVFRKSGTYVDIIESFTCVLGIKIITMCFNYRRASVSPKYRLFFYKFKNLGISSSLNELLYVQIGIFRLYVKESSIGWPENAKISIAPKTKMLFEIITDSFLQNAKTLPKWSRIETCRLIQVVEEHGPNDYSDKKWQIGMSKGVELNKKLSINQ